MAEMKIRPEYHFTPYCGWINDPNGIYLKDGYFHVLFQYNKHGISWGMPSIGHVRTRDFIHFEEIQEALIPTEKYEKDLKGGCFSGSVIEKDNELYLVYTGSVIEDGVLRQTQNIAVSKDGYSFTKFKGNPVIKNPPEEGDANFRDPKVIKINDTFYLVVGCKSGFVGAVFIYSSQNLVDWKFDKILYKGEVDDGSLFECPDFYEMDNGKWILTFSPENNRYGIRSLGIIGCLDKESMVFIPEKKIRLDYGLDYYARQSYILEGRRLSISWLNEWPWMSTFQSHGAVENEGWCGCLSMPREEKTDNGKLISYPIEEIMSNFVIAEEDEIEILSQKKTVVSPFSYSFLFSLVINRDNCRSGEIIISVGCFTFYINFERNYLVAVPLGKNSSYIPLGNKENLMLDFFFDNSILELFVNKGESSASWIFSPESDKSDIIISVNQKRAVLRYSLHYIKEGVI